MGFPIMGSIPFDSSDYRLLPYFDMEWTIYYRTIRKEKAVKLLRKIFQDLTRELQSFTCERNPNNTSHFRLDFTIELETTQIEMAVTEALLLCQKVLPAWWRVNGPSRYDGGLWEFMGHCSDEATGLIALNFFIRNYAFEPIENIAFEPETQINSRA